MTTGKKIAIGLTLWSILMAQGGCSSHTAAADAEKPLDLSPGLIPKAIPYETALFSIQYPYGTHVVTHDDHGENRHGKVYDGFLHGDDSLTMTSVSYEDFPTELNTDFTDAMLAGYANMLKPGYSESPVTDATLSDLPARELVARGIGKGTDVPVTVRLRIALSPGHTRMWLLFTMSDERGNGLSEADSNKFFDSFKIK
jgi:hypothetical protein